MKELKLKQVDHECKVGSFCKEITPNVSGDTALFLGDKQVGVYLENVPEKAKQLMTIANKEFLSDRVPKQEMSRGPQGTKADKAKRIEEGKPIVTQYSAILGSVAPKPHMRRDYPTISSLHAKKSASTFIKAMVLAGKELENLLKKYMPEQYQKQKQKLLEVDRKWRLTDLYTSAICNLNIAAAYHIDRANVTETVNIIYTKRRNSKGGCLYVPDYEVCFSMPNDSVLIYPAWANLHGVTPINAGDGGYRNSLIFYPLKGFERFT